MKRIIPSVRTIGYSLVIGGFVWLISVQISIRLFARSLVLQRYELVSQNPMFTSDQVKKEISVSVFELANSMPWILPAGVMMLVGSILLDQNVRQFTQN